MFYCRLIVVLIALFFVTLTVFSERSLDSLSRSIVRINGEHFTCLRQAARDMDLADRYDCFNL